MHRSNKGPEVPELLEREGGLAGGATKRVADATGIPEADVYGVGSFFHLLAQPRSEVRVCTGLSCQMAGASALLAAAQAAGLPAVACACLAACDRPPAVLKHRRVLPEVTLDQVNETGGDWTKLCGESPPEWEGHIGPTPDPDTMALHLGGAQDWSGAAIARARELGTNGVIEAIESSGLQGRGGAGFPAHIKWKGVVAQDASPRYVVLNADEGEPGTFKDREVLLRRPDRVLEGLAIAAHAVGAKEVYLYLRGEFEIPWGRVERAIEEHTGDWGVKFHLHAGHGAYICGEETALLEAIEGKRGMPRLKPPYPTEFGLFGKPTLIHNVETIACVPSIVLRGPEWFRALGREEAGPKLYCVSGHVKHPGTYELPLGVTLDELVEAAGGYEGELLAFSPGGASSGFLPASERTRPLSFKALGEVGSMLGSAGVVVLNHTTDMRQATLEQLRFFEVESCGQCAPCRIGTRYLREALEGTLQNLDGPDALKNAAEVAWEMNEGSICGLGQAAPLPLTSALKYFPEAFAS